MACLFLIIFYDIFYLDPPFDDLRYLFHGSVHHVGRALKSKIWVWFLMKSIGGHKSVNDEANFFIYALKSLFMLTDN